LGLLKANPDPAAVVIMTGESLTPKSGRGKPCL